MPINVDLTRRIDPKNSSFEYTNPQKSGTYAMLDDLRTLYPVQALSSAPVDGQTIYFGNLPKAPVTTANISRVYIRKACTIRIAEIYCYAGTAGTSENWSLYIRKNNTTDTLIATVGASTNQRIFSNTSLSIAMDAGDYFEIKAVNPTWATNPNTAIFGGYILVE